MEKLLNLFMAISKAALNCAGCGLVGDIVEIAKATWELWEKSPKERLDELEAIVKADDEVIACEVNAAIAAVAGGEPEAVRTKLATILKQIPGSIRRAQRRPDDPTGRTIRPGQVLDRPEDLIPLLWIQLARFNPGDRPLPGLDWELVELIGSGGFGEVWKARHTHLQARAPVALKFCTDPQARERLLRYEAKVCDRVMRQGRHPGIVQLQETYLSADPPCLQYEYIDGGDLGGLILDWRRQEQRPSSEQVAETMRQISEIVGFAHRLDPPIVHRDLKPANILVQRSGGTIAYKVADFGIGGIATAQAIQATHQVIRTSQLLTTALRGSGTLLYASPEQMRGDDPDPRDDVHALGVLWYQMLTGDLTQGRPSGSVWRRRLLDRGMAAEMIELLESCFEDRGDRPADAAILAEQLGALPTPAPTSSGPPPRTGTIIPVIAGERLESDRPPVLPRDPVGEVCRFEGHTDRINSVAFWPSIFGSHRRALSGSDDDTMRLWDLETGHEIKLFEGHVRAINSVAFSPEGRRALSGSDDHTVRLWDMQTGQEIRRFEGHETRIKSVTFARDGHRALSGGEDRIMRLWDVETSLEIRAFEGHSMAINCVAFAPDGRRALSAGDDHTVRLWDTVTGREIKCFKSEPRSDAVNSVAFAPDGRRAVSGSNDRIVRVYDLVAGREIHRIEGHTDMVNSVAFAPDGRSALSGSWDRTMRLWDVEIGCEIYRFEGHTGVIKSVVFEANGRGALSGSWDGTMRLWRLPE